MELVKKHLMTILCAVCVLLLLLPLASVVTVTSSELIGETRVETSLNGFNALGVSVFAYLLVIGPALLVAMNYIKQLDKYKSILAIVVPLICIVALIIVMGQCDSISASAGNSAASAKIEVSWSIGAFLLLAAYVGTAVAGAVNYHGLSLNKEGLKKLKQSASGLVGTAQEKVSAMTSNHDDEEKQAEEGQKSDGTPKAATKKSTNLKRTEEILELLERLNQMKAQGILTEEEFTQKKQQLLEEI